MKKSRKLQICDESHGEKKRKKCEKKKRPDTPLPQSRAGGQGLYLRSLDHLGRSIETKEQLLVL